MVEFMSQYMPAMDRFEERPIPPMEKVNADIEAPLVPIGEIGTTSVDAGQGNILQELEKNIKMGTKKIQIVFSGRGGSGVSAGGGPTLYGKEVREALREKAKATGVELVGVELSPAVISGLAGYDPQSGRISEEKRQADLKKVRDAVRFAADVSKGGGVDLWSQEFTRNIYDAEWNKKREGQDDKNKWAGKFFDYSPEELTNPEKANIVKYLIDKKTGDPIRGSQIRTGEDTPVMKYMTAADYEKRFGVKIVGNKDRNGKVVGANDKIDAEGNYVDEIDPANTGRMVPLMDKDHNFQTDTIAWKKILERTEEYNRRIAKKPEERLTPEMYLYRQKLETQKSQLRGQSLHYSHNIEQKYDLLQDLIQRQKQAEQLEKGMSKEQQREWISTNLGADRMPPVQRDRLMNMKPSDIMRDMVIQQQHEIQGMQELATSYKLQEKELEEMRDRVDTPQRYAYERSITSYAEAGIDAMKVTQERKLDKPIYIGPELGWAGEGFGGHPEEFVSLIKDARKKMAKELIEKQQLDPETANEKAKTHIKGMVDTSHLAMWFKHFKKEDGWSDKKHLSEFNKWMKEQARYMVESGVVGAVQVVDSFTGEHSHLPAGQGVFEVADFVKEMKKAGFSGPIISEGHEEDTMNFGQGRILTEAWRAFGSNVSSVPSSGSMGLRGWGGIQHSYFGQVRPPNYIVGAYAPSNEWSLWSETPFE